MATTGLHISLAAEPITHIGGLSVTNAMFTSLIVSALLITFAFVVNAQLQTDSKPKGLQNIAEMIIEALYNLVHSVAGSHKKARAFFPLIATFFLWIMVNNYFGLLPGVGTITVPLAEEQSENVAHAAEIELEPGHSEVIEVVDGDGSTESMVAEQGSEQSAEKHAPNIPLFRPGTADLNTTLALALISIFMTQVIGLRYLGISYFKKFINFSNPIAFYVGILELISEFAKIVSFAFRLFGNIFAGEVLLVVIGSLMPIIAPMPFYGLELFVGFIQALVFAILSLVFFNMATQSHEEH